MGFLFLLLQPLRRPRLRRQSWGPPPWCGAAAAEVSETEPGLEQATLEATAMAIATSVSPPGRGGGWVETFRAALHSVPFISAFSLSLFLVPFFSRRLCPSTFVWCSLLIPLCLESPFSPPPPLLLFFFLEAVLQRGEGASLARVLCAHLLAGTDGRWRLAGACDWEASGRLGGGWKNGGGSEKWERLEGPRRPFSRGGMKEKEKIKQRQRDQAGRKRK